MVRPQEHDYWGAAPYAPEPAPVLEPEARVTDTGTELDIQRPEYFKVPLAQQSAEFVTHHTPSLAILVAELLVIFGLFLSPMATWAALLCAGGIFAVDAFGLMIYHYNWNHHWVHGNHTRQGVRNRF